MYTLYILFHYYFTYYTYYFSYYFFYYFTAYYYFMYYFTINSLLYLLFLLLFLIISFASLFSGAGDANSRLIRRTMTDKCPGAPTKHWDDQASLHYEDKPTYSAEKRVLYALYLVLFVLFRL